MAKGHERSPMNFPHITTQLRKWNTKSLFEIVADFLIGHVLLGKFPMSRVKGEKKPCNVLEVLKGMLQLDKKYAVGEHNYTGAVIIEKVELHLLKHEKESKKGCVISDGRHRGVAMVVAEAFGADPITAVYLDVDEANVRKDSFEANVAHEKATPLSKIDKLKEVIGLIESKEAQKEADIQILGLTRYQAQEFWAKAMLVRQHGFTVESAAALKKEDARKAAATADAKAYLADNAGPGSTRPPKAVSGKVIRDVLKLMEESHVDEANGARRVLNAIATGDEVGLRDLAFEIIKA